MSKRRNSAEGGVTRNNPSDASQIERVSSVRERERTERAAQNSIQLEGALMSIFFFSNSGRKCTHVTPISADASFISFHFLF